MKLKKLWQLPSRSFKHRVRVDDIAPDGVLINVMWDKFVPGASVFVPCINTIECVRQLNEVATYYDWTLDVRIKTESGTWGVRVWRVL